MVAIEKRKFEDCFKHQRNLSFGIKKLEHINDGKAFSSDSHSHHFYYILIIKKGRGIHTIDFQSNPISNNSIFFVSPGQIHALEFEEGTQGYALFFKTEFYDDDINKYLEARFGFFNSFIPNPIIRNKNPLTQIYQIAEELFSEYRKPKMGRNTMIKASVNILLLKLSRLLNRKNRSPQNFQHLSKIKTLESLIDRYFKTHRNLEAYAELMHLSAKHLNDICQSGLNKTVAEMIHQRTILEAKRLIHFTDFSITEIGYELGFWDSSYFFKYFKKHIGVTPESYRQSVKLTI